MQSVTELHDYGKFCSLVKSLSLPRYLAYLSAANREIWNRFNNFLISFLLISEKYALAKINNLNLQVLCAQEVFKTKAFLSFDMFLYSRINE